jgi:predicted ATPase
MISRVEVLGYRCLRYVDVPLPPFAVLVGPNASGKTTFLDALAVLRDLLRDGAEQAVGARVDELEDLTWMRSGSSFEIALELDLPEALRSNGKSRCRYAVKVGRAADGRPGVLAEGLWLFPPPQRRDEETPRMFPIEASPPSTLLPNPPRGGRWRTVLRKTDTGKDYFKSETGEWNIQFRVGPRRAVLSSLPEDESRFPAALWLRRFLMEGTQVLQLNSVAMRQPVSPRAPRQFEPDGSNLPLVLRDLKRKRESRYQEWVKHLRTILPDLRGIDVEVREADRFQYLVLEYASGLKAPAWLVSDGTLRMLALTLLAYIDARNRVFLIEEPENGLHPRAVEPVYQSLSSVYEGQVLIATHNVLLLGLAKPGDILVFARTESGAADIVPGTNHPALRKWKGDVDLGTLLAAGILG